MGRSTTPVGIRSNKSQDSLTRWVLSEPPWSSSELPYQFVRLNPIRDSAGFSRSANLLLLAGQGKDGVKFRCLEYVSD